MGMQRIRVILPESIDVYLNDVIIEKTRQELATGVQAALQDSGNTQASTMSPVNTFRTLFRTARYSINTDNVNAETGKVSFYEAANGFHIINIPTVDSDVIVDEQEYKINPMMFLGFSVEYANTLRGNAIACRMLGSDMLEETLRDYCNSGDKNNPIAVLNSIPEINGVIEQSKGVSNEQLEVYTNTKNCKVAFLNIKYIKIPNVVKYDDDLTKCVNCDLSSYTHHEIVERAVAKFLTSIGAGTPSQANQQQRQ